MTEDDLRLFEEDIARAFNEGRIRAPVHLTAGNEAELVRLFAHVRPRDWVLCTWRSHYHCLLKGVPPEELKAEILRGRSISLCFPEYRILSSAIATGILPIAVGLALASLRDGTGDHVYCFLGDMTSETGAFAECLKYAEQLELPVTFVIEDNGMSIGTPTKKVWNLQKLTHEGRSDATVHHYTYRSHYPHAGAGQRIKF